MTVEAVKPTSPLYRYRGRAVRAVDGDTVIADIDLGFKIRHEVIVRLLQVDTPERGQPGWREASAFTAAWLTDHPELLLHTAKSAEKYGRWLAHVWDARESLSAGPSLNQALIDAGHGRPW